jgi:hypothetical protein
VIFSTTHNFDSSSVVEIVRTAARLPMVNHLVIGQAKLCTARCKSVFGPCCCFQPVGTELVNTHWGNSKLPFTIYRRIVRWVLKANEVARVSDEATVNALNAAQLDPRALMAEKGLAVDTLKSPSLPSMEPERGGGAKASGGAKAKTTTTKKNEGEKTEKIRISIKVVRVKKEPEGSEDEGEEELAKSPSLLRRIVKMVGKVAGVTPSPPRRAVPT